MGDVVDLDAERPGWWSGVALCKPCHNWWLVAAHPNAPLTRLECPKCHAQDSIPAQVQDPPEDFQPSGL
jgi:hypothetical protein